MTARLDVNFCFRVEWSNKKVALQLAGVWLAYVGLKIQLKFNMIN